MTLDKILLMGNPNVGKSAIFSRLTGAKIVISNYPGTTVEFTQGKIKLGNKQAMVIDVPGTYTLEPTCKAEEVAVEMLKTGDLVINVVNATNQKLALLELTSIEFINFMYLFLKMSFEILLRSVNSSFSNIELNLFENSPLFIHQLILLHILNKINLLINFFNLVQMYHPVQSIVFGTK